MAVHFGCNPAIPSEYRQQLGPLVEEFKQSEKGWNFIKACCRNFITKFKWKRLSSENRQAVEYRINQIVIPGLNTYYHFSPQLNAKLKLGLKYAFVEVLTKKTIQNTYFTDGKIAEAVFDYPNFEKQIQQAMPEKIRQLIEGINDIKAEILPHRLSKDKNPQSTLFIEANKNFLNLLEDLKNQKMASANKEIKDKSTYQVFTTLYRALTTNPFFSSKFKILKENFEKVGTSEEVISQLKELYKLISTF